MHFPVRPALPSQEPYVSLVRPYHAAVTAFAQPSGSHTDHADHTDPDHSDANAAPARAGGPPGGPRSRTTGSAAAVSEGVQDAATAGADQPAQVSRLTVLPWPDPVIDLLGVDPRSDYVERYWLPLVGPASVLLLRYLAHRFDETPEGFSLDVTHTARVLGLGTGLGRWGPLQRTVHRCANFGFARRWGDERLLARRHLPTVTRQQLARLPDDRRALHEQWRLQLARPVPRPDAARTRPGFASSANGPAHAADLGRAGWSG